jgi:hypothetical protein
MGERVKKRFVVPERRLTIALLGSVTLMGRNMFARDVEGTVFAFVEPTSPQRS